MSCTCHLITNNDLWKNHITLFFSVHFWNSTPLLWAHHSLPNISAADWHQSVSHPAAYVRGSDKYLQLLHNVSHHFSVHKIMAQLLHTHMHMCPLIQCQWIMVWVPHPQTEYHRCPSITGCFKIGCINMTVSSVNFAGLPSKASLGCGIVYAEATALTGEAPVRFHLRPFAAFDVCF